MHVGEWPQVHLILTEPLYAHNTSNTDYYYDSIFQLDGHYAYFLHSNRSMQD